MGLFDTDEINQVFYNKYLHLRDFTAKYLQVCMYITIVYKMCYKLISSHGWKIISNVLIAVTPSEPTVEKLTEWICWSSTVSIVFSLS
jgi:hypothetical protein